MQSIGQGNILKMRTDLKNPVEYNLPIGPNLLPMNSLLGKKIQLSFDGRINCISSGEQIKKSYGQGYSYKSFITLAECDMCMVRPEQCHYSKGTCRDNSWGEKHCLQPHFIYLAKTSHVKVGITRQTHVPYRWIDQGADEVLPILKVKDRLTSGLVEVELAKAISDKTDWRAMLMGKTCDDDLIAIRENLFSQFGDLLDDTEAEDLQNTETIKINYPILEYPKKINSLSFDKQSLIEGTLMGIKGQYLIFDTGVINLRKYQGYFIDVLV